MTVREEPSPLTGGPRRRPGRRHRPRRSDPRRASRAWIRAPAQKQRPHRRTTSGRGGQGPRSPGSSSAEAIGGARGSSRRHHGTETPENGAAAIGSGGRRGGGRPAPRSGGGRKRSQFAPPARGRSWRVLVIGLRAAVRPAGARAGPARGRRPAPGRRRIGSGLRGRPGETSARSRPTAVSRARGRGSWRRSTGMMPASGLASARAGPTAREERRFHARNARLLVDPYRSQIGATPPRPERATEHREAAFDDPVPPRPAIRAPQDDVFTSSRGGHGPHRASGICTGTARPRRSPFLFIKTTNPGCQVWSERGTKHKHASTAIFPQVPSRSRRERSARHRPFGPPVQSAHIESGTARWPGLRLLRARLARQRRRRDRDDPIDGLTTRR